MDKKDFKVFKTEIFDKGVELVAVSKTRSTEEIMSVYDDGQRDFGENRVQEWAEKQEQLPKDIRWHLIGHIQTNKVKYLDPLPYLIHSIDRKKLAKALEKEGVKRGVEFNVLLQIKIASEETKYGFDRQELLEMVKEGAFSEFPHLNVKGVMGMASLTDDTEQIRKEFRTLKSYFELLQPYFDVNEFTEISMGMSGDYEIAIAEGSTMIRVGSLIFGPRNY